MDEKDNKEAPKDEAANTPNEEEQKITVNIGGSSKEDTKPEEPANEEPKEDESIASDDSAVDEVSESEAKETEQETEKEAEPKMEDGAMPVMDEEPAMPAEEPAPAETITPSPVKDEEPVKPEHDTGPELKPSVQPIQAAAVSPPTEVAQLKKRNKILKVWLVIFVLLLVALLSAGLVYFNQQNKNSDSTAELESQNARLQQQLVEQQQNATQQTIDQLNKQLTDEQAKTAELTKTIETQEVTIEEYRSAVTELLEACGTACDNVDVPRANTETTTQ